MVKLELWQAGERLGSGVFIIRTFPASYPTEYLSVRGWNADGDELELGMIANLGLWPEADQREVSEALARRYLMREIEAIVTINLRFGFVDFEVRTTTGPARFSMRWTQSQAIDFGENGKLITDTEENRYLIRDIGLLSRLDQEKFLQYVYW